MSYDKNTRTFSLNSSFDIYINGKKFEKSGGDSIIIGRSIAPYGHEVRIYYDRFGILRTSNQDSKIGKLFTHTIAIDEVPVATVLMDSYENIIIDCRILCTDGSENHNVVLYYDEDLDLRWNTNVDEGVYYHGQSISHYSSGPTAASSMKLCCNCLTVTGNTDADGLYCLTDTELSPTYTRLDTIYTIRHVDSLLPEILGEGQTWWNMDRNITGTYVPGAGGSTGNPVVSLCTPEKHTFIFDPFGTDLNPDIVCGGLSVNYNGTATDVWPCHELSVPIGDSGISYVGINGTELTASTGGYSGVPLAMAIPTTETNLIDLQLYTGWPNGFWDLDEFTINYNCTGGILALAPTGTSYQISYRQDINGHVFTWRKQVEDTISIDLNCVHDNITGYVYFRPYLSDCPIEHDLSYSSDSGLAGTGYWPVARIEWNDTSYSFSGEFEMLDTVTDERTSGTLPDLHGFENLIDSTLLWDEDTNDFTIDGLNFNIYVNEVPFTKSTETIQLAYPGAGYYVWYDDAGDITAGSIWPGSTHLKIGYVSKWDLVSDDRKLRNPATNTAGYDNISNHYLIKHDTLTKNNILENKIAYGSPMLTFYSPTQDVYLSDITTEIDLTPFTTNKYVWYERIGTGVFMQSSAVGYPVSPDSDWTPVAIAGPGSINDARIVYDPGSDGFLDLSDSYISYNAAQRRLDLIATDDSFQYYLNEEVFTRSLDRVYDSNLAPHTNYIWYEYGQDGLQTGIGWPTGNYLPVATHTVASEGLLTPSGSIDVSYDCPNVLVNPNCFLSYMINGQYYKSYDTSILTFNMCDSGVQYLYYDESGLGATTGNYPDNSISIGTITIPYITGVIDIRESGEAFGERGFVPEYGYTSDSEIARCPLTELSFDVDTYTFTVNLINESLSFLIDHEIYTKTSGDSVIFDTSPHEYGRWLVYYDNSGDLQAMHYSAWWTAPPHEERLNVAYVDVSRGCFWIDTRTYPGWALLDCSGLNDFEVPYYNSTFPATGLIMDESTCEVTATM
jgi:hypothetical protein